MSSTKHHYNTELLQSLLGQCALRDEKALDQLYRLLSSHLFALIIRIVTRKDWAEEILQETFVSLWNNAGSYHAGKGHPVTWVVSIARNRSIDWLRNSANRELNLGESSPDNYLESVEFDTQLLEAEVVEEIMSCLDELELDQRNAISLVYYKGYSHQELAKVMRSPLGTVKSWVRRGLMQLKRCLDAA